MRLYLVRHGDAVEKEDDSKRPLSVQGRKDIESVGAFLAKANVRIKYIWHSGKMRAQETAEILAKHIAKNVTPEKRAGLSPEDDPSVIAKALRNTTEDLMLVGHLPHLELLASVLITGKAKYAPVAFDRGTIVAFERVNDEQWCIVWTLVPSLLA